MPADQKTKNGIASESNRKRVTLTFGELTDIIVENGVRTEQDLWSLAKRRKVAGDDTLWNRLGDERSVTGLLQKINNAWFPRPEGKTLKTSCAFPLAAFHVPPDVQRWVDTDHKKVTLVLSGPGEIGKTALAAAALMAVCPGYHFISRRDQAKSLIFIAGEGILWDEASLADVDIDACKHWLD